jgi:hypothetical protein
MAYRFRWIAVAAAVAAFAAVAAVANVWAADAAVRPSGVIAVPPGALRRRSSRRRPA